MPTTPTHHDLQAIDLHPDRIRELIPRYTRAGILRRTWLPDGGVEFVVALTDRVFATFDARGRLVG